MLVMREVSQENNYEAARIEHAMQHKHLLTAALNQEACVSYTGVIAEHDITAE